MTVRETWKKFRERLQALSLNQVISIVLYVVAILWAAQSQQISPGFIVLLAIGAKYLFGDF